jgi:FtsP/CotA-like multicopper oxidase with cupredoxin domain
MSIIFSKGGLKDMGKRKFLIMGLIAALVVAAIPGGINLAYGNAGPAGVTFYANSPSGINPDNLNDTGTALRKFFDALPGVSAAHQNLRGQFIPIAVKDTTTYPGCDYYQIGVVQSTELFHTDLPLPGSMVRGYVDLGTGSPPAYHYGGPIIIAKRDRPVRVLYTNQLPTSPNDKLFLPVDQTIMGSGLGPDGVTYYTQNRTTIHLHGGYTPWISDGMPHQYFTPAGETNPYSKGVSYQNVPDMPTPPDGSETSYYPNQQSNRLQFYHDHAWGMTRLTVYSGQFAPYLITDAVEDDFIDGTNLTGLNPTSAKLIPDQGDPTGGHRYGIPLIIQDKGFVPLDVATQDSAWDTTKWGGYGNLWWPHVYEPNQSQTTLDGANPYGRWDYGPWVWPNITAPVNPSAPRPQAAIHLPGTTVDNPEGYTTCAVPESFMDTPVVNGCAYPYLNVQPQAYRFRILNANNDRYLNLSLFLDASGGGSGATATATVDTTPGSPTFGQVIHIVITNGGTGYNSAPGIIFTGGGGFGAWATATISGPGGIVNGITITNGGRGYTSAPTITIGSITEVKMVPAVDVASYPDTWPTDGRNGGVPAPASAGPSWYAIGSDGGWLPGVAVIPPQPVSYQQSRQMATVLNVTYHSLYLGPAERADVVVDFSGVPVGTNVIMYNDAPAPNPGFEPRYDYYTGDPDQTGGGGAPQTLPGLGPNTRTIMQFRVQAGTPTPFNLAALQTALPNAYVATQPPPIVPETFYPGPYKAATDTFGHIQDESLTYTPVYLTKTTKTVVPKALIELFDSYGRMNATIGTEVTNWAAIPATSTGIGFHYIDPPTENLLWGQPQIWKITHNGVDTHLIHIHLVNWQLINRVGWDGTIVPPDENERGWKETIKMNPLEDVFVAVKATRPIVPFSVPDSIRPLDPSMPLGTTTQFTGLDAQGNPITVVNAMTNFHWEFMWHCHLLGHEDNDMMRPITAMADPAIVPVNYLLLMQ